jgi:hypothetical protein
LDAITTIDLPDWPKFKAVIKEFKLIKQLPKGEKLFMRTSPTCTYGPLDLIPFAWAIYYWLIIDANTHVLSSIITTNVGVLKPNIVTSNLESNAAI